MARDLRGALLRKEEFESGRLIREIGDSTPRRLG
jgi:hypothetical protein